MKIISLILRKLNYVSGVLVKHSGIFVLLFFVILIAVVFSLNVHDKVNDEKAAESIYAEIGDNMLKIVDAIKTRWNYQPGGNLVERTRKFHGKETYRILTELPKLGDGKCVTYENIIEGTHGKEIFTHQNRVLTLNFDNFSVTENGKVIAVFVMKIREYSNVHTVLLFIPDIPKWNPPQWNLPR